MGSLSEASYDMKEAHKEIAKEAEISMEMEGVISVEDYEKAGLVIMADELLAAGGLFTDKMTASAGVALKENPPHGVVVINKGGDDTEKAPEMAASAGDGGEENGKKEWEMEMEVAGEEEEAWPGAWAFERDADYFQWIWYCPDGIVLDYQLPDNYKFL